MVTAWSIPLADTTLGEDEALAAAEVVRSGWLTQGPRVEAFERAFAQTIGATHALAVTNCTVGLELAMEAVGVGRDSEVIVPALTFVATANAARRLGADVVFADVVSPDDLTIDPADVARKVTPRTRAICAVHYAGFAAAIAPLRALGIPVVEDCAHAPGAKGADGPCGTLGDIAAFSFFSNKNLTTGEGGMVTTQREALAVKVRAARSHGMTTTTWDRHRGHAFTYDVPHAGTNARMDEIRAAIGMVQLGKLGASNDKRRVLVEAYRAQLSGTTVSVPFVAQPVAASACHVMVVLLPAGTAREAVMTALRDARIQTSIHYPPTHRFGAYQGTGATLPVTDAVAPRLLTLPLYPGMTLDHVAQVCDALRAAVEIHGS